MAWVHTHMVATAPVVMVGARVGTLLERAHVVVVAVLQLLCAVVVVLPLLCAVVVVCCCCCVAAAVCCIKMGGMLGRRLDVQRLVRPVVAQTEGWAH
jgi:hypothetical protein